MESPYDAWETIALTLFPPDTIVDERYRILTHVGDGGSGSVFKAVELGLDRVVALKILLLSHVSDDDARARFIREGKVLSRLAHPNLPIFYRFGVWQETWRYIALEFLEGRSMRSLMDSAGPLSVEKTFQLGVQIASAIQIAHANNIIHRDIKPDNIMLIDSDGTEIVKVVDFGLAKMGESTTGNQSLTRTGELVGSVFYMSPEQCKGLGVDGRSDIYALGCTLYEALSGAPPLVADNPIGLMHKHVSESPPLLDSRLGAPEELGKAVDAVLFKAMAKDPLQRYGSMAAFAEDMQRLLEGKYASIAAAPPILNRVAGRDFRRTRFVIGLLFATLLIACVLTRLPINNQSPIEVKDKEQLTADRVRQIVVDVARLEKRFASASVHEKASVAQLIYTQLGYLATRHRAIGQFDECKRTLDRQLVYARQCADIHTAEVRVYGTLAETYRTLYLSLHDPVEKKRVAEEANLFFKKILVDVRGKAKPETMCSLLLQHCLYLAATDQLDALDSQFTKALESARQQEDVLGSRSESMTNFAEDLFRIAKPVNQRQQLILCDIYLDICEHQAAQDASHFTFSGEAFSHKKSHPPVVLAQKMFAMAYPPDSDEAVHRTPGYLLRLQRLHNCEKLVSRSDKVPSKPSNSSKLR